MSAQRKAVRIRIIKGHSLFTHHSGFRRGLTATGMMQEQQGFITKPLLRLFVYPGHAGQERLFVGCEPLHSAACFINSLIQNP